jgi:hypothetical protein
LQAEAITRHRNIPGITRKKYVYTNARSSFALVRGRFISDRHFQSLIFKSKLVNYVMVLGTLKWLWLYKAYNQH